MVSTDDIGDDIGDDISDVISDDKKAEAVRNVFKTASDAESGLARTVAYVSPYDVQKAGIDSITSLPGFEKFKDITKIFSGDLGGPLC